MITGGHWEWSVYFAKSRDSTVFLQFRSSKLTLSAAWELAAADAFMASWTCKTCKIYHWCALQDLLNNLESCDLDDDDLMLDVDVSEEASLHSGMNPSVWVLSAASVVEAATVPSKFLQMETPSPTWLSGEGDNSAGGCRKFMITGGVGFTPVFIKFPPPHFGVHQISPVILPATTRATNWTMLGKRRWPCAGTRTSSWTSARRGDSQHRKTELSPPAVSSDVSAPLTVYKDGWSRRDFTRWFVNACSED